MAGWERAGRERNVCESLREGTGWAGAAQAWLMELSPGDQLCCAVGIWGAASLCLLQLVFRKKGRSMGDTRSPPPYVFFLKRTKRRRFSHIFLFIFLPGPNRRRFGLDLKKNLKVYAALCSRRVLQKPERTEERSCGEGRGQTGAGASGFSGEGSGGRHSSPSRGLSTGRGKYY